MRKAFTLVEMMIVVVVLVTLMSITFRLSSIGEDQSKRSRTIMHLQRVENCLSGYMAAFGTYPPVPLYNKRDIYLSVRSGTGIQNSTESRGVDPVGWSSGTSEEKAWLQVKAACMAQPVGFFYPYGRDFQNYVTESSRKLMETVGDLDGMTSDEANALKGGFQFVQPGRYSQDEHDWREQQIYQFGLLSFLLPRYLVAFDVCDKNSLAQFVTTAQWLDNNTLPYDPFQGDQFSSWSEVYDLIAEKSESNRDSREYLRAANITSQAICARWISNLSGICHCQFDHKFYGTDIRYDDDHELINGSDSNIPLCDSDGIGKYILDGITIEDGWHTPLFYYSPPPYQTYTLWSAGPNRRTFPPWIDRTQFSSRENQNINSWIDDDIAHMSN